MFSLTRVNSNICVKSGYILPKQSLTPLICAQFETYSKQQSLQPSFDLNQTRKGCREERRVLPQYCHNLYHPLGLKKSVFIENNAVKYHDNRNTKLSQPVLGSIQSQKLDVMLSLSKHPDSRDVSSSRRSSKIVIPRHLKFEKEDVIKMTSKQPGEKKTPPKANLELISYQLTQDLTNIFMKRQEWRMYSKDLVFVDNVRGSRLVGLEKYIIFINLMRMLAHVRFVYVRLTILSVVKDEEASTVKIRWNIVGLGMARLVLRYFPDRLWEKGNMERLVQGV